MGTDQYDRILVVIGEGNELPVNWTMVMTGNAHHYDFGDSAGNILIREIQQLAKSAKQRLWRATNPVGPYL